MGDSQPQDEVDELIALARRNDRAGIRAFLAGRSEGDARDLVNAAEMRLASQKVVDDIRQMPPLT